MSSSFISNIAALNARGNVVYASRSGVDSVSRLSSGERIARAADDVAGLATGTSLRTQVTGIRTAIANASQGISLLQVVDGSLSQIVDILQRQKAIAVQAGSGSLTDTNRQLLNQEFQALTNEVNRIASTTSFNGVSLLSGGLGEKTRLARTDNLAFAATFPGFANSSVPFASVKAIQAFDVNTGQSRQGSLSAGQLEIVDSSGVILSDGAYEGVNEAVYGQFSNFEFSDVNFGATGAGSAMLTATMNGVRFSGNVISAATGGLATLRNGNSYMRLVLPEVSLTNAGAQSQSLNAIINTFSSLTITRTSTIEGVNFEGTRLDGAIGDNGTGNASLRIAANGAVEIKNFKYEGNAGAANTNVLSVEINGRKFMSNQVNDTINPPPQLFSRLYFLSPGRAEALQINFYDENESTTISDIRTNLTNRQAFVDALNIGFSRAGSGLNFGIGSGSADVINVRYGSASADALYGGQGLEVSSTATATRANTVLDDAINRVISLRANVGALQSRFGFASMTLQSSLLSQDSARASYLDTDVASESSFFASTQVQLQAGVAILAQANQLPAGLLNLLDVSSLIAS